MSAGNVSLASLKLGSNIRTLDWAPQTDILGHPNLKAFVTHGGINSLYEAMHNAVPVAVIPMIADQPFNLKRVSLGVQPCASPLILHGSPHSHFTCIYRPIVSTQSRSGHRSWARTLDAQQLTSMPAAKAHAQLKTLQVRRSACVGPLLPHAMPAGLSCVKGLNAVQQDSSGSNLSIGPLQRGLLLSAAHSSTRHSTVQAERHGFGIGIPTERLTPANPSFVHRQLQRLLEDDQYKVAHPHHHSI